MADPSAPNARVLLEQARRYVDAEDGRAAGLQTRASTLAAAVAALIGLTFTLVGQLADRDVARWAWLAIAGATLVLLVVASVHLVEATSSPQRVSTRSASRWRCVVAVPGSPPR